MKIQFTDKDPRSGRIVEIESRRARKFIDSGLAREYSAKAAPSAAEPTDKSKPINKKAKLYASGS